MHPHILATLALALPALVSAYSPAYTKLGCYSSVPDVKGDSTNVFQSLGMCVTQCAKDNYKIAVLSKGDHCACSNALPPDSSKIDDDKCNTVCPGYPTDNCKSPAARSRKVIPLQRRNANNYIAQVVAITPTRSSAPAKVLLALDLMAAHR